MSELAEIREAGVKLQVYSEWGPWGPCEHCIHNRGYKTSIGTCRLKRDIDMVKNKSIINLIRVISNNFVITGDC